MIVHGFGYVICMPLINFNFNFDGQQRIFMKRLWKLKVHNSMEKIHTCSHMIHAKSYEKQ